MKTVLFTWILTHGRACMIVYLTDMPDWTMTRGALLLQHGVPPPLPKSGGLRLQEGPNISLGLRGGKVLASAPLWLSMDIVATWRDTTNSCYARCAGHRTHILRRGTQVPDKQPEVHSWARLHVIADSMLPWPHVPDRHRDRHAQKSCGPQS